MSANWRLKEKKTAQCISIHLLRKKAPSIPVCESRFLTSFFKSHRSACMVSEMFIKLLLSLLWQYRSKGWEDHNAVSHQLFISLPQLTFSLWQIPGLSTHGLVVFSESLDISICSQTSDVFFPPWISLPVEEKNTEGWHKQNNHIITPKQPLWRAINGVILCF